MRCSPSVTRGLSCPHCGQTKKAADRFCSRRCYNAYRHAKRTVHCPTCGKPFLRGEMAQAYCSHPCYTSQNVGPRHVNFRGYVTIGNGYRRLTNEHPTHPGWYEHEMLFWVAHPLARCADCGGRVRHIHHVDRDKQNNAMDNLVGLCVGCHRRRHAAEKP